jgi:hypothetical protein
MSLPTLTRAEANRANAQKSTGPRTADGMARSRANALTHGLTSRELILLPTEDAAAFEQFRAALLQTLSPIGPEEAALAETIVAQHWRLQRIPALEVKFLASPSAAADLSKLSLHEQRLTRLLNQNRATLAQLQAARRAAEHEVMVQAAALRKLHEDHKRPFNPADFGFVFSLEQIDRYRNRCTALGAAKAHAKQAAQAFLNPEFRPKEVILPASTVKTAA